ncbi:unnamed protein product [Sphagnum balticum]
MGLFGGRGKKSQEKKKEEEEIPPPQPSKPALESTAVTQAAAKSEANNSGIQTEASVFEFGSAANSDEKMTLAGYCPISDELEPCRWEILPSGGSEAPQFRVIF